MQLMGPALVALLLLAGCAAPPKPVPAPAAPAAAAAPALLTGLRYDGTTVASACASAVGRGICETPPVQPGSGGIHPLAYPGSGKALHANVTWTPAVPAFPNLRVVLLHKASGGFVGGRGAPAAIGPSPLALAFPLNGTADGWALGVYDAVGEGAAGAGAAAYAPQAFHVEGTITSA